MDVVVFGAGSLGSLVGGLLARRHDVTLVGRDPHVAAVRESGLTVDGVETFRVAPAATTDGRHLDADLAVVTVKSYDTDAAADALASGSVGVAVSLQNGMGNEDVLADRLDCPVVAGTTACGAVLADPGRVEWRGGRDLVIGPWSGDEGAVDRVASAFRGVGLATEASNDIRHRLWRKLAVNAAVNPITALSQSENGELRDGPARALGEQAARETARVARAEGVALSPEDAVDALETVVAETAANHSSMYRDLDRGGPTEIDAITGYVVDRATSHDVPVPANRTLLSLVRATEASHGEESLI